MLSQAFWKCHKAEGGCWCDTSGAGAFPPCQEKLVSSCFPAASRSWEHLGCVVIREKVSYNLGRKTHLSN